MSLALRSTSGLLVAAVLSSAAGLQAGERVSSDTSLFRRTFFAGAYFDPSASPSSQLVQRLVAPIAGPRSGRYRGNELTPVVRDVLRGERSLVRALHLDLGGGTDGNPVAVFVSRAQDTVERFPHPDPSGNQYGTTVFVTVSLDVFTDQPAYLSSRRFESLYSQGWVAQTAVITSREPLSPEQLASRYRSLLEVAVRNAARAALAHLGRRRKRAAAVFQIDEARLGGQSGPELDRLIEASLAADGRVRSQRERQREQRRLGREIEHLIHEAVLHELDRRGRRDLALMPPPSPWTEAGIVRLLRDRVSYLGEQPVLSAVDPSAMNGYSIKVGLWDLRVETYDETDVDGSYYFKALLLGRILRRDPSGGPVRILPARIVSKREKTATAWGAEPFAKAIRSELSNTRPHALSAIRDAARQLAPQLVDLMEQVAREIDR